MIRRNNHVLVAVVCILFLASGSALAVIPPSERDALIALFNDTGGPGWFSNDNWLGPAGTECTWFGVACSGDETRVVGLYLGGNNLEGPFPGSVVDLPGLRVLGLRENQLFGPLAAGVAQLSDLVTLDLASNQITGQLPTDIGNLLDLEELNLHGNQVGGEIPASIGNLAALRFLDLANNQLSGQLPIELDRLINLETINLYNNQLSGPLPDLGGLTQLQFLVLAVNDFSGDFPQWITSLTNLEFLDLGGNWISGEIPPGIGDLSQLTSLWLYSMNLSGEIPASMMSLTNLQDDGGLNICGNQLFTDSGPLALFLDQKQSGGDWRGCQIPTARFDWYPQAPEVGEDVLFADRSTSSPIQWDWDLGDGTVSSEANPIHSYTAAGVYTVQLTVDNGVGSSTVSEALTVGRSPTADFSWEPEVPVAGAVVRFASLATGSPNSWSWDFGDGVTSTSRHPSRTFAEAGVYSVALTVTNALGSDSMTRQVTVVDDLTASFTWSPPEPREGRPVQFTDTSAGVPDSWSWTFGDGGVSTLNNPMHTYSAAGEYMVSLTVGAGEVADSTSQLVTVAEVIDPEPGPENEVSPPDAAVEPETASATDRSGRRVVVWSQTGGRAKRFATSLVTSFQEDGVFARLFDPGDEPLGGPIQVSGQAGGAVPTVSFDGIGSFVVGWQGGQEGIFGRYFDTDGEPMTDAFQVDDQSGVAPETPRVAAAASGAFVAVWRQGTSKQGEDGIFGRFFDPGGDPSTGVIQIDGGNLVSVSRPGAATSASGRAIVVWRQEARSKQGEDGVFGRYYDPTGEPEGSPIAIVVDPEVQTASPQVGSDAAGDAVVVWAQDVGQGHGWDIYAVLLDADGAFRGEPFVVNTVTDGDQVNPSVGVNPAGDFTVAWSSGGDGVFGRFYDPAGTPLGPQFTMVESDQGLIPVNPEVSVGGDDTVTVSYTRVNSAGQTRGAFFRSFAVASEPSECLADDTTHCLNGERFQVTVGWRDFGGSTGAGRAVPLTDDTGTFWFFDEANVELILKVLDGTGINGHFWVFYGALSNVEYSIVVTDTATGSSVTYFNPSGVFASVGDTEALPGVKAATPRHVVRREPLEPWVGHVETGWLASPQEPCVPGPTALCLNRERFKVEADWRDFAGNDGSGQAVPLTSDTGTFWFFDEANVELVLKVLDGRGINGHFWVFFGALSNVEYTITVTDTDTGEVRTYMNPLGEFGSIGDTEAFEGS